MSDNAEQEWKKLCDEYGEALDVVNEVMADRSQKIYQDGDWWGNLTEAQDRLQEARKKLDDFRKQHGSDT